MIRLDDFPVETGWYISDLDNGGSLVIERPFGTYFNEPAQTEIVEDLELPTGGMYEFVIEDLFGDGLCCNTPGFYKVYKGTQLTLIGSGSGDFGSSASLVFQV